jgi:hypothetical protein
VGGQSPERPSVEVLRMYLWPHMPIIHGAGDLNNSWYGGEIVRAGLRGRSIIGSQADWWAAIPSVFVAAPDGENDHRIEMRF